VPPKSLRKGPRVRRGMKDTVLKLVAVRVALFPRLLQLPSSVAFTTVSPYHRVYCPKSGLPYNSQISTMVQFVASKVGTAKVWDSKRLEESLHEMNGFVVESGKCGKVIQNATRTCRAF
jgi:hypothetical protein